MIERKLFECKRCHWEWFSKMDKPHVCPKCHSAWWDVDKREVK